MRKETLMVRKFHALGGVETSTAYRVPSEERIELRKKLMREELEELIEVLDKNLGPSDLLKEASDVMVTVLGTVEEYGLGEKIKEAFRKVMQSNLSKFSTTQEIAEKGKLNYIASGKETEESMEIVKVMYGEEEFFVLQNQSGKILKGGGYRKVNLLPLL